MAETKPHVGPLPGLLPDSPRLPASAVLGTVTSASASGSLLQRGSLPICLRPGSPREGGGVRGPGRKHLCTQRGDRDALHFPFWQLLWLIFFLSLKCNAPLQQGGLEDSRGFEEPQLPLWDRASQNKLGTMHQAVGMDTKQKVQPPQTARMPRDLPLLVPKRSV